MNNCVKNSNDFSDFFLFFLLSRSQRSWQSGPNKNLFHDRRSCIIVGASSRFSAVHSVLMLLRRFGSFFPSVLCCGWWDNKTNIICSYRVVARYIVCVCAGVPHGRDVDYLIGYPFYNDTLGNITGIVPEQTDWTYIDRNVSEFVQDTFMNFTKYGSDWSLAAYILYILV